MVTALALMASMMVPLSKASIGSSNLGEQNVILGAAPTRTAVTLPRAVEIANPAVRDSVFRIRSEARFAGFALVLKQTLRTWVGGRVKDRGDEVYFLVPLTPRNGEGDIPETFRLPRGEYDLFVVADVRTPVKIWLDLEQLDGSTRIQPSSPAQAQVKFPNVRSLQESPNVHWVTAEGRIPTASGSQLLASWFTASRHAATSYESCFYKGEVPESDRSMPACAAFNAADMNERNTGLRVSTYPRIATDRGRLFIPAGRIYTAGDGWAPGRYSGALSVRTAAVEGKVRALALWLGY